MSGLDFENSIQKKVKDLSLTPSPEVWNRVDKTLKDRKRKKRAAWIFFFALLLGSGFIFQLNNSGVKESLVSAKPSFDQYREPGSSQTEKPANTAGTDKSLNAPHQNLVTGETLVGGSKTSKAGSPDPLMNPQTLHRADGIKDPYKRPGSVNYLASGYHKSSRKHSGFQMQTPGRPAKRADTMVALPESAESILRQSLSASSKHLNSAIPPAKIDGAEGIRQDDHELFSVIPGSLSPLAGKPQIQAPLLQRGDNTVTSSTLQQKKKKETNDKKWTVSIQAAAGASQVFQQSVAEPAFTLSASVPSSANLYQYPPSEEKTGSAFQAGIHFNRPVSRKLSVVVGLGYAYYSNHISIGNSNNSSTTIYTSRQQVVMVNSSYYASGNTGRKYVNQYHYLQAPIAVSWTPDLKKRWAITAGISAGYLISDNALQYDDQAGIYYHDKLYTENWRSDLHTTIQYRFLQKNGIGISAGPMIQYQLNSLDRHGISRHFGFLGFATRFYLQGNK